MKKLRVLVPVFSFGLILAYAVLSQFGDGSLVAVSKVYAQSSKSFSSISNNITINWEASLPTLLPALAGLIFFVIVVSVFFRRYLRKQDTSDSTAQETTEEQSDD